MILLLQAIQTTGLYRGLRKASSLPSCSMVCAMVLVAFCSFSTITLSAHESHTNYDVCNDVTNGGTIAANQTGCGDPLFDPDVIVSTSPATGGDGALEYIWISSTDDPNGVSSVWNTIAGSTGESYDPGPISQTTSYRRCARRTGCTLWVTESNIITIELDCSLPSVGNTVFFDENGNGIQDNNEPGVSGVMVKLLDAGADGIFGTGDENIVRTVTTDSNGDYLFVDVAPGTYIIEFMSNSLPNGFTFTTPNVGDDANDSDADNNGQTDPFTVGLGDADDLTFDAGLIQSCSLLINSITGVNPMCHDGNTGIVALSVIEGAAPFTYIWSNGETTQDIDSLTVGTYCVTITDSNGCTLTDCVTLTAPNPINVNANLNPEVCDQSNGNIDLVISGGTAPYTYLWNNGATTQDLNNLPGGTYCVTITDVKGCQVSECFTINSTGNNSVSISPNNNSICPGETINLNADGSTGSTYTWTATGGTLGSPNSQNTSYTMMMPGVFTITVVTTNAQGCTASNSTTVTVNQPVDVSGNISDAGCGENNGSISLNVTSGTAPYTYIWSTGATTQGISNLAAGTYCVTVNDANGCNDSECFNVNSANSTPVTLSGPGSLCPGESITFTASSTDVTSYSWSATGGNISNPGAQSTAYTMMTPGTYTITVVTTNTAGCTSSASINVIVYEPIILNGNASNASCGQNDGAINISTTSGIAPFTYTWSNGATTQNINGLAAGTYCVTINDAVGCHQNTECFTVNGANATPVTINGPNAICPGESINLVASSTDATSYSWSATGGTLGTANAQNTSYTMMAPGTYTITVVTTNTAGCTSTTSTTVTVYQPVNIAGTVNDAACGVDDGSINLTLSSGPAPFTYEWSTGATTQGISNLAAGSYCVTVNDANGCQNSECFIVQSSSSLSVSLDVTNISCLALGSITAQVTGGLAPFTYAWNTGQTTGSISGLNAGEYCVMVTDANGCQNMQCTTLTPVASTTVTGTVVNPICDSNNGSITTSLSQNISVTYSWSNGQTTPNLTNLVAGTYSVTVTTTNGCTSVASFTLVGEDDLLLFLTPTNPTCGGTNDGMVTSLVTRTGSGSLTYTWSNGATTPNINNLSSGEYCLTVTSSDGCDAQSCVILTDNNATPVTINGPNAICPGESINLIANSSDANSYSWSATGGTLGTASAQNTSYTMMMPGTYTITVVTTNNAGCTSTASTDVTVYQPVNIAGTVNNASCGVDNGSINLTLSSGAAPFTYAWNTGATTQGISNLAAGTYCVTVNDANGCQSSECFTIQSSSNLSVSLNVTAVSCNALGSITAQVSGGLSPFTYAWNTGQTTGSISGLSAGEYCVTVTDANGCQNMQCTTLTSAASTTVTGTVVNPTCGSSNGSISTTLNPNVSVTYSWSNGQTTPNIANLVAGVYSITVTTVDGCTSVETFTLISEGDLLLSLTPTNPSCQGLDNGQVVSNVTFTGSGSLIYTWSNGATTPNITDLPGGNYCLTVTSSDGCDAQSCVTLIAPQAVNANAFVSAATCGNADGKVKITVTGGTAPYKFDWSNGATTEDIVDLAAGEYCVAICDANGCTFNGCFTVAGGANFNTSVQGNNISCNGAIDGSATATTDGGTAPFTYLWNTGATTSTINNLVAGLYCATVTDAFGCSDQDCVDISAPLPLNINVSGTNTTCGQNNGSAMVSFNFTASNVIWTGQGINANSNSINNLAAGTYTVEVTSQGGCSVTELITINPSSPLNVTIAPTNTTICPGETVTFTSSPATSYAWTATGGSFSSASSANPTYTMMMPGTYTITLQASNADGCTDSETATITVRDNNDPICNPNMDLVNIGNYVWSDINNNGIQDPAEIGIGGIEVKLLTAGPDGIFYTADDVMIATEVTDAMGFYLFENVAAGDYIIMFCIDTLTGIEFTTQNTGANDGLDSDANPLNGKTDPFTVIAGQNDNLSFDAGIIISPTGCDNITDAGEVCCDQDVCGAGTIPDLIANTSSASGGSGAIEYIWMSTTLGGPFNINTWNEIPGATGAEYQPGPLFTTTFIARCARRAGCDNYFETDIIKLELVTSPVVSINSLPAFICVGETDNFNSTSAGISGTYSWDLGAGANPATATGQSLTNVSWSTPGAKTITLTTTNFAGCTFVITRTVTVGSCLSQPVSDRFINFSITPMEEVLDVDLKWNTHEDMNDFHFIIEHSIEGEEFEIIHSMDGKEAYEAKDYSYIDESARPGRNYYRIKHINNNGQTERSETLMVTLVDRTDKFILFPNPTIDYVIFESLRLTDEEGVIVISDMKGLIINEIIIPPNTKSMRVDLSNLTPGTYALFTKYIDVRSVPQIIFKSEK